MVKKPNSTSKKTATITTPKNRKTIHPYQRQRYPALNAKYQVANRRELIDMDYLDKLNGEEMEWLNAFISETVVTNFKHRGDTLIDDVEKRRELYRENNKRNADVYAVSKATHNLVFYGEFKNFQEYDRIISKDPNNDGNYTYEDQLIDFIDDKKKPKED